MLKNSFTLSPLLILALLGLMLFSMLYAVVSPATTAPDEIAHSAYPRHMLLEGAIPSFTSAQDTWESHQPPLYYLSSIPVIFLFKNSPIDLQLIVQRLVSVFWIGVAALFLILTGKKLFPQSQILQALLLLPLSIPMVLYAGGTFSNDISVLAFSSILLYCMVHKDRVSNTTRAVLFGVLIGGAMLTKFHLYPVILISTLVVLWKKPLSIWLVTGVTALFVSSWWFIHNMIEVGDLTGLRYTFLLWQSQQTETFTLSTIVVFVKKTFASFFGVFGKQNIAYPAAIYLLLGAGFFGPFIFGSTKWYKKPFVRISLLVVSTTLLVLILQSIQFFQPQGRYLIAIIPFLGIPLAYTLQQSAQQKTYIVTLLAVLLLGVINIYGLFLIHQRYSEQPIHSFAERRTIHLLETSFVDSLDIVDQSKKTLTVKKEGTVYTLADFRFPSSPQATLNISSQSAQDVELQVYWKILGMHEFSDERSLSATLTTHTTLLIPEKEKTLIQDVQFTFRHVPDTFTITDLRLNH